MTSPALERFDRWVTAREPETALRRFRTAFAGLWLVYDLLDLTLSGTARCRDWGSLVLGAPHPLQLLQLGLIVSELLLLLGRAPRRAAAAALLLRLAEAVFFLHLNDFWYFATVAFVLTQADLNGDGPRWVRDVLVMELGWIYLATGLLKLNPQWLSGVHLFVRQGFLAHALHWPYPAPLRACAANLGCDHLLALLGVASELTLGTLIVTRRLRPLALLLALGIHGFGALGTNVWFFGPSMLLQLYFLTADPAPAPRLDPTSPLSTSSQAAP